MCKCKRWPKLICGLNRALEGFQIQRVKQFKNQLMTHLAVLVAHQILAVLKTVTQPKQARETHIQVNKKINQEATKEGWL